MDKAKFLNTKLKNLKEHEVMRNHTTMRVGGVADFYYIAENIDDLVKAIKLARQIDLPYFILGNGSNIIFSDYGFPGLVIKNNTSNIAFMKETSQVIVDSGVNLQKLILESTSQDLAGLEFLYGVPGTVGGAIYGNAGAYNQSIGDYVKYVTLLMPSSGEEKEPKIVQYEREWLDFTYRSSKLKKINSLIKPVILSAKIQLAQSKKEEIMRRINLYKNKRMETQPYGGQTVGSIFKNPIPENISDVSGAGSSGMPEFARERTAGFLLEKSGAKKLKVGGARVSEKHANFIIGNEEVKSMEVRQLIENMRSSVNQKYQINLEEEIEYIGQW